MKTKLNLLGIVLVGLMAGCGQVKEAAQQVSNAANIEGHWLMVESGHANELQKVVEKESMVLSFKEGQAAFSPTDDLKGEGVFALLGDCSKGPRPYRVEKNQIVFGAVEGCAEVRVDVEKLDASNLKFPDPSDRDIVRSFVRINEDRYNALVKPSERKP